MVSSSEGGGVPRPASSDAAWSPDVQGALGPPATARGARQVRVAGYDDLVPVAYGGDSVVYRGRQVGLDRLVAVKVVHLEDPETRRRFARELELTVRLGRQHPNIVTVLDTGTTEEGDPCIVMDYADLGSLADRLAASGPLPVSEVVAAGVVVADALAFAHSQGVLHRDVKPQNVLVLPTSWVLADFGIARLADAVETGSLERFSYRHASPQVLDGQQPTAADDVWSLGSTLFTLLEGRTPFAADDPAEDSGLAYLRRARTEPPSALRRDDVPDELRALVARCLAPERADRWPGAAAVRDGLSRLSTELRGWAPTPSSAVSAPAAAGGPVEVAAPAVEAAPRPITAPVDAADEDWAPGAGGAEGPAPEPALTPAALRDEPPAALLLPRSALGHLPAAALRPVRGDDAPTGLPPVAAPPPAPSPSKAPLLGLALVAVALVGAVLLLRPGGPGGTGATGGTQPTPPPPTEAAGSATVGSTSPATAGTATGGATTTPTPTVGPPPPPPELLEVAGGGPSFTLRWTDASGGTATFVLVERTATSGTALKQVAPGTTRTAVTARGKAPHCFAVIALLPGQRAVSAPRCAANGA